MQVTQLESQSTLVNHGDVALHGLPIQMLFMETLPGEQSATQFESSKDRPSSQVVHLSFVDAHSRQGFAHSKGTFSKGNNKN